MKGEHQDIYMDPFYVVCTDSVDTRKSLGQKFQLAIDSK